MSCKPVHTDSISRILELRRRGMSYRDIAKHTGVPKSTVFRMCKGERVCDRKLLNDFAIKG